MRKLEAEQRYTNERYNTVLRDIVELEVQLGVTDRWTPEMKEYVDTIRFRKEQDYRRALEQLEALIVKCLFELQWVCILETGEFSGPWLFFLQLIHSHI